MKRKTQDNIVLNIFQKLYIMLLCLSLVVVITYIVFKICVPPPKIEESVDNGQAGLQSSSETVSNINQPEADITSKERKKLCYTFLLVASDKSGLLADVIMVVKYDTVNQDVGVVSIPRDTLVDPNDIASYPKINFEIQRKKCPFLKNSDINKMVENVKKLNPKL